MNEAWIIDACRTPRGIGKPGKGALSDIHPQHLGATVLKALSERNDFDTAEVGDIVWGTSSQRGVQGGETTHRMPHQVNTLMAKRIQKRNSLF